MIVIDNKPNGVDVQAGKILSTIRWLFGDLQQLHFAYCDLQSSAQGTILTVLTRFLPEDRVQTLRLMHLPRAACRMESFVEGHVEWLHSILPSAQCISLPALTTRLIAEPVVVNGLA